ncbi:right-handed parallel beta-helix repeat-containing protein [Candidatus Poribacteria bacterium]
MLSKMPGIAVMLIVALIQATTAMGARITVDDDAPADYRSIQAAIDAAQRGDTIQVGAGAYMEHIRIYKSDITLQGSGHEVTRIESDGGREATIIVEKVSSGIISGFGVENIMAMYTGDRVHPAAIQLIESTFILADNEIVGSRGPGVKVEGGHVEIRDSLIQEGQTGIYLSNDASAEIMNNRISWNNNHGVYAVDSQVVIESNQIMNNQDGIAFLDDSEGTILNNSIYHNEANGIWCRNSSVEISHNTIAANQGRAIFFDSTITLHIRDNVIVGSTYGIYGEKQWPLVLEYNDVWGNDDDYLNCQPDATNMSVNPMFVNVDEGDFRLYEGSPLVGAASDGGVIGAIAKTVPLGEARGIVSVSVAGSPAYAGDSVTITMIGESRAVGHFSIEGVLENVLMREIQPNKYQGEYRVEWGDDVRNQPIITRLITDAQTYENMESSVTLDGTLIQSIKVDDSPAYFGQSIEVEVTGIPRGRATFTVTGIDEPLLMWETSDGQYLGTYLVRREDAVGGHYVTARLSNDRYFDEANEKFEVVYGPVTSVTIDGSPARASGELIIKVTGKPGANVNADILGIVDGIPLTEENLTLAGVYKGIYEVQQNDDVSNATVLIHFAYDGEVVDVPANQMVTIDTIEPDIAIKIPQADGTPLRNGDTFTITLDSEEGAIVKADLSMLDTTQGFVFIAEISSGMYGEEVKISHDNLAINGEKMVRLISRDAAGNESTAFLPVKLMNPIAYTKQFSVSGYVTDPNSLLGDDAIVMVYNATMGSKMEAPIDSGGNYAVTFFSTDALVAEVGTLLHINVIDGPETRATVSHHASKAEIDAGEANIDLAITYLTIEPETLPADGHSMALIEIQGLPKTPSISASSGTIEQLSFDPDLGVCMAIYTAGLEPGVVDLMVVVDGTVVSTGNILLEHTREAVSNILLKGLSNRILVGKTVHITGVMTPPLASTLVELEVFTPTGLSWLEYTQTQDDGAFDFHIRLDEPETWRFRAFHGQTSSTILAIRVEAQPYMGYISGKWRTYTTNDGLADDTVEFALEDSHGTLWLATTGGVSRLEGEEWEIYTTADGLGSNHVKFLLEDNHNILWAGTWNGGLSRLVDGTWETYTTADGLGENRVTSILEDSRSRLWVGTWNGGLSILEDGTWEKYTADDVLGDNYVTFLLEDSRGNLWISTWGGGVSRLQGNIWRTYMAADGLGSNYVKYLLEDSRGVLWAATEDGLSRLEGETWGTYITVSGPGGNHVRYLLEDSRGVVWAATEGGLGALDGEAWRAYTTDHGLGDNFVNFLLEDSRGNL